jgi:hypothetical protein
MHGRNREAPAALPTSRSGDLSADGEGRVAAVSTRWAGMRFVADSGVSCRTRGACGIAGLARGARGGVAGARGRLRYRDGPRRFPASPEAHGLFVWDSAGTATSPSTGTATCRPRRVSSRCCRWRARRWPGSPGHRWVALIAVLARGARVRGAAVRSGPDRPATSWSRAGRPGFAQRCSRGLGPRARLHRGTGGLLAVGYFRLLRAGQWNS